VGVFVHQQQLDARTFPLTRRARKKTDRIVKKIERRSLAITETGTELTKTKLNLLKSVYQRHWLSVPVKEGGRRCKPPRSYGGHFPGAICNRKKRGKGKIFDRPTLLLVNREANPHRCSELWLNRAKKKKQIVAAALGEDRKTKDRERGPRANRNPLDAYQSQ